MRPLSTASSLSVRSVRVLLPVGAESMIYAKRWPLALAFSCVSLSFGFWLVLSEPFAGTVVVLSALSGAWVSGQMYRVRYRHKGRRLHDLQLRDDDERRWPEVFEARQWWVFSLVGVVWLMCCYRLAAKGGTRVEDVVDTAIAANLSTGMTFLSGALFGQWRSRPDWGVE